MWQYLKKMVPQILIALQVMYSYLTENFEMFYIPNFLDFSFFPRTLSSNGLSHKRFSAAWLFGDIEVLFGYLLVNKSWLNYVEPWLSYIYQQGLRAFSQAQITSESLGPCNK